ncbi:MAG: pantothenate synthase [Vezdaea aestivalis]|nr:MAG: pantothenate synthase [Vezdaea aestivalis]
MDGLVIRDIPAIRAFRRDVLMKGKTVGLVPTMGALHDGHLSLIRQAAVENDNIFVSIFVNPTQFGVNEDLSSYPRTWKSDLSQLGSLNDELREQAANGFGTITAIFAPTAKEMYPTFPPSSEIDGNGSFVTITPLSKLLEGASRPVFFRGVATVCMKLFNIMTPDRVYFGQKDIQQTVLIKQLVKDFAIGTEVVISKTIREPDGLAMSSRNAYLGSRRRDISTVLVTALRLAENNYQHGARKREEILDAAIAWAEQTRLKQEQLPPSQRARFEIVYFSLADPDSMEEVTLVGEQGAILSGAIKLLPHEAPMPDEFCGLEGGRASVRLIDNIILVP